MSTVSEAPPPSLTSLCNCLKTDAAIDVKVGMIYEYFTSSGKLVNYICLIFLDRIAM